MGGSSVVFYLVYSLASQSLSSNSGQISHCNIHQKKAFPSIRGLYLRGDMAFIVFPTMHLLCHWILPTGVYICQHRCYRHVRDRDIFVLSHLSQTQSANLPMEFISARPLRYKSNSHGKETNKGFSLNHNVFHFMFDTIVRYDIHCEFLRQRLQLHLCPLVA